MQEKAEIIVNQITNYVNSFSLDRNNEFAKMMSIQHRTLQQSFTRLCLRWLEHISKDEYRTDPRNEDSKKIAKEMIAAFKKEKGSDYNPSDYISMV